MPPKQQEIRDSLVVGATFKLKPDAVIVDRSTLARMRNFPDRHWFIIPDDEDEYVEGSILLVPNGIKEPGPLVPNVKNLIVLSTDAMVQLIESEIIIPCNLK